MDKIEYEVRHYDDGGYYTVSRCSTQAEAVIAAEKFLSVGSKWRGNVDVVGRRNGKEFSYFDMRAVPEKSNKREVKSMAGTKGKRQYSVKDKSVKYRAEVKAAPQNAESIPYKRGYVQALDDVKKEFNVTPRGSSGAAPAKAAAKPAAERKEYSDADKARYYKGKADGAMKAGDAKAAARHSKKAAEFAKRAK